MGSIQSAERRGKYFDTYLKINRQSSVIKTQSEFYFIMVIRSITNIEQNRDCVMWSVAGLRLASAHFYQFNSALAVSLCPIVLLVPCTSHWQNKARQACLLLNKIRLLCIYAPNVIIVLYIKSSRISTKYFHTFVLLLGLISGNVFKNVSSQQLMKS